LNLSLIFFQAASPKGPFEFIFSNCFERLAPDNGQLEFIFSNCFERLAPDNGQLEFIFSNCFERLAPDNGQLEFIFPNCFERLARDNGQLEFIFSNCFERLVLNNGQLEFTFHFLKSVIPSVSGPEMSPIKCLSLQTISLPIHFEISQYPFKILFSFHSFSYYYQHGSRQSFSPVKLQYPLAESGPFLQRIWVSLCSSSFKTNHLHHPTFIITSQAFITS